MKDKNGKNNHRNIELFHIKYLCCKYNNNHQNERYCSLQRCLKFYTIIIEHYHFVGRKICASFLCRKPLYLHGNCISKDRWIKTILLLSHIKCATRSSKVKQAGESEAIPNVRIFNVYLVSKEAVA